MNAIKTCRVETLVKLRIKLEKDSRQNSKHHHYFSLKLSSHLPIISFLKITNASNEINGFFP